MALFAVCTFGQHGKTQRPHVQLTHLGAQRESVLAGQLPQIQDEVLRLPLRAVHLRTVTSS